jgi:predicted dehydrogenase
MNENDSLDFNRRDFLKGSSVATIMTMLGGVELFAQTNATPAEAQAVGTKVKVAVIGLGAWGRELVNTLARLPQADIVAVCDTYAASLRRGAESAPSAAKTNDYKTILDNKEIKAVIVSTGSHQHKDIVLAALKAGKHVYCEAPLAHTIEDARAIAMAAREAKLCLFQAGLQYRSDPQRHFLLPFIRSGALGRFVMARAQWHKKTSWRVAAANPEREKELNWRLSKETSPGLIGELGVHPIDQAAWFLNARPAAVTGFSSTALHGSDGRDVPDTARAIYEFPAGVTMTYDATLANSFDADFEMVYGSDAAVMLRDNKAWMFKEVDSPLFGWEIYASKETFYKETGIVLKAGNSKATSAGNSSQGQNPAASSTPISFALSNFLLNAGDVIAAAEDFITNFGADDQNALAEQIAKVQRRDAAGYLEGYQAAVLALKGNEAAVSGKRLELKPEMYELV